VEKNAERENKRKALETLSSFGGGWGKRGGVFRKVGDHLVGEGHEESRGIGICRKTLKRGKGILVRGESLASSLWRERSPIDPRSRGRGGEGNQWARSRRRFNKKGGILAYLSARGGGGNLHTAKGTALASVGKGGGRKRRGRDKETVATFFARERVEGKRTCFLAATAEKRWF